MTALLLTGLGCFALLMVALWRLPAARPRVRSYEDEGQP